MRLDPSAIAQQISNLKLACPEAWEDNDDILLSDMLVGSTDLTEFLTIVVDRMRDASCMAGGVAGRIAELELRQKRYERREQAMRDLAFRLMQMAEVRTIETPEATLSVRNGTPRVIITDESQLAPEFIRTKTEVDKGAIKVALKNGAEVAGACFSNSEPSLSVRTR